jgi:hypothetical protein
VPGRIGGAVVSEHEEAGRPGGTIGRSVKAGRDGGPEGAYAVISTLPPTAARLLAIEVLLSNPESLGDDVLESCLYLLRERLQGPPRWQDGLVLHVAALVPSNCV